MLRGARRVAAPLIFVKASNKALALHLSPHSLYKQHHAPVLVRPPLISRVLPDGSARARASKEDSRSSIKSVLHILDHPLQCEADLNLLHTLPFSMRPPRLFAGSSTVDVTMPIQCMLRVFFSALPGFSQRGVFHSFTRGLSGSPFQRPSCLQSARRLAAFLGSASDDAPFCLLFVGLLRGPLGRPRAFGLPKPRFSRCCVVVFFARQAARKVANNSLSFVSSSP